jgi:hypothetical protein
MDDLAGWHDFYVMLGAAAATLTGLVAMSLHLRAIAETAVHRGLARGSLIALMAIVIACGVALLPGSLTTFGLEIAMLGAGLTAYNVLLVARATRLPGGFDRRRTTRAALYISSPLVCAIAGALIAAGIALAAYLLAATLLTTLVLTVTNTWSLLLDVSDEPGTAT